MLTLATSFTNTVATIEAQPAGYVHFTYRPGRRDSQEAEAALRHTSRLLVRYGWYRLLNDQRLMEPLTFDELARISNFWRQQTRQLGCGLHVASVVANDVFARLVATQLRTELRAVGLHYRVFDEEQQAVAWLLKQTTRPPLG